MSFSHHQPNTHLWNTEMKLSSSISHYLYKILRLWLFYCISEDLTIYVTEMKHQLTKMQPQINRIVTRMIDIYL